MRNVWPSNEHNPNPMHLQTVKHDASNLCDKKKRENEIALTLAIKLRTNLLSANVEISLNQNNTINWSPVISITIQQLKAD